MLPGNRWQKSSSGRFLLILGAVVFLCVFAGGLFIIFDNNIFTNFTQTQRILFGSFFIIYAVLRFSRLLKKKQDEI